MNAREAVNLALTSTQGLLPMYLADLADADLLVRPVPGANHIAWQLGHLINSEKLMAQPYLPGAVYPELPSALAAKDSKEAAGQDSTDGYRTKAEYLDLFHKVRNATLAGLAKLSDADLDKPNTGPMAAFAPNLASLLVLVANHTMMHAGQFTVVRRKLGKPILF